MEAKRSRSWLRARWVPDAVIFDLDGVLVDTMPLWREAETAVFGALGVPLDEAGLVQTAGMSTGAVTRFWHMRHPWSAPPLADVEAAVVARVQDLVRQQGRPMPGALRLIDEARAVTGRIAVATNSPRTLAMLTLDAALGPHRPDVVATVDCVASPKPAPDVYLEAARQLGVLPRTCLAIDDSPHGIRAALEAGMVAVGICTRGGSMEAFAGAHVIVDSPAALDLAAVLAALRRAPPHPR